jgi:hypothetical protein
MHKWQPRRDAVSVDGGWFGSLLISNRGKSKEMESDDDDMAAASFFCYVSRSLVMGLVACLGAFGTVGLIS